MHVKRSDFFLCRDIKSIRKVKLNVNGMLTLTETDTATETFKLQWILDMGPLPIYHRDREHSAPLTATGVFPEWNRNSVNLGNLINH